MTTTKRGARKIPALTPADVLGMLASAITYLQQAGLTVKAGNDSKLGLVLAIEGAQVSRDVFGVMTFEPVTVASTPTAEPASTTSTPEAVLPAQV